MDRLKKIMLSVFVIATFGAYAFQQRHESEAGKVTLNLPKASSTDNTPTTAPAPTTSTPAQTSTYKDGTYTGTVEDAYYGNIQVQAVVKGGQITDVVFLQHPSDRSTSVFINEQAMPMLKQEAIKAQSGNVDIVSGATDSSMAFVKSLTNALNSAHV